jgi:hypothetical protein
MNDLLQTAKGSETVNLVTPQTYELDWTLVKTFEDLLSVISCLQITVTEDSPMRAKLERWLKRSSTVA